MFCDENCFVLSSNGCLRTDYNIHNLEVYTHIEDH